MIASNIQKTSGDNNRRTLNDTQEVLFRNDEYPGNTAFCVELRCFLNEGKTSLFSDTTMDGRVYHSHMLLPCIMTLHRTSSLCLLCVAYFTLRYHAERKSNLSITKIVGKSEVW